MSFNREELLEIFREAIGDHACRFDISPKHIDQLVGMIENIGDGDFSAGVRRMQRHHDWLVESLKKDVEHTADHAVLGYTRHIAQDWAKSPAKALLWGLLFLVCLFALAVFGAIKLGAGYFKLGG